MMDNMQQVEQALAWARGVLAGVPDVEPLDAQLLLMHVLGVERAALMAYPEYPVNPAQAAAYRRLIMQRADGVPIAYLIGRRVFYDREFIVSPAVLIPRPETEHLVEEALAWARGRSRLRVVDVGTGSGAIAVTLAAHLPDAAVIAIDVSIEALDVARQNAARYDLAERITFIQGDLLAPVLDGLPHGDQLVDHRIDLIAANLPYIAGPDLAALPVTRFEPRLALDGGPDGLDLIRRLLAQVAVVLAPAGLLLLEIGAGQGERVRQMTREALPGARVTVLADYAGHDRVIRAEIVPPNTPNFGAEIAPDIGRDIGAERSR
ncbi:MAG: peptide chain release factor N(5)-glutamine methyltransferase [Anaerolineae bacterium]|nr:peptide chain release factor N(5)-glutamine methyltransferase [Anaerolineae bacterium]